MTHQMRPELCLDVFSCSDYAPLAEPVRKGTRKSVLEPLVQKRKGGAAASQTQVMKEELGRNFSFVASTPAMQKVRAQAEVLAKLDVPLLIVGETGTGKEVVARLIHSLSNRSANRFLKISCAALDLDAMERGLFGDEKGKSPEETRETSPFVLCNQGTILLGDIDDLPARAQARLLSLLQDNHFFSGANSVRLDVRILAATTADVGAAMASGKLRKDLYYCLSAFTIPVPPLRQRTNDIPILMDLFMDQFATDYGLPVRSFSPDVLLACKKYPWPGNVRELEKFVKRYLVSGDGEPWSSSQLCNQEEMRGSDETAGSDDFDFVQHPSAAKSLLHNVREEAERNAISNVLKQTRWNRRAAARLLNVSYRTLLYKIQQYEMSPAKR